LPGQATEQGSDQRVSRRRLVGLGLGPLLCLAMLLAPPPPELGPAGWRTVAVASLMAVWWITEAIPIAATALLPLVLFPVLGVRPLAETAAPYANPVIFLFLGGFLLAQAMQRWGLHRRIALRIIGAVGTRPVPLIGGFMIAAAFLSMWISNTATAVMMLPIGLSVIQLAGPSDRDGNFGVALMLGIAYACSIGGLGTLIGTPPNAFVVGYLADNHGIHIGFGQWMLVGMPLVLIGLPVTWLILTRWVYPVRLRELPGGRTAVLGALADLGPASRGEKLVGAVFLLTALAWMTRPILDAWIPGLSDEGIAITAGVALFLIPVSLRRGEFVLDWASARGLPWDVLVLFGGGLSLAGAIAGSGVAGWIGGALLGAGVQLLPTLAIAAVAVTVIVFLTELMSNTAAAAAFLPILAALAVGIGQDPLLLTVPAALAASCAFMMPVATPPNAIVYGSGHVSIPAMARAGIVLNVVFAALVSVAGLGLVSLVFLR
jgi:solute carrier family 13 (sodium-dependent dicarboxylate transporter), member 2/3/5